MVGGQRGIDHVLPFFRIVGFGCIRPLHGREQSTGRIFHMNVKEKSINSVDNRINKTSRATGDNRLAETMRLHLDNTAHLFNWRRYRGIHRTVNTRFISPHKAVNVGNIEPALS